MIDRHSCLCAHCWSKVYFIPPPVQKNINDIGLSADENNEDVIEEDCGLTHIRSVTAYCDISCVLVRLLKYHDRGDLAIMMAQWMFRIGKDFIIDSDVIIAVPLHRFRLIRRQYNQSAELARLIAHYGKKPFLPGVLVRNRNTKPQVDLSISSRKKNLCNAFCVQKKNEKYIRGLKILLVDDVYTTGSTAHSATMALKRAGAMNIRVITFARSLKQSSSSVI
ncbi:MAG: ComF family protein [Candidatus Liberibacter ctenarytainae]|uniref:ComF family protein n=1 Tax=Candidatus Liberibacter ctenarytainae TaxID=2020335 RepID=A0A937AB67_9HYPH|nr:ComF family protein [Candidatus Liberibacter ctenarytainae]